ncbi:hypothetical protein Naga_101666g2 [Nannochloropsis gaditana]|uniref:Uncharacterized protein n=1 Tax=Nannochloropsis gaditana TaxID=72520 RepID=W7U0B8_9STRA|nr:hypothetical protein Naga_101666g2 [Nannochloropsis gaditana]
MTSQVPTATRNTCNTSDFASDLCRNLVVKGPPKTHSGDHALACHHASRWQYVSMSKTMSSIEGQGNDNGGDTEKCKFMERAGVKEFNVQELSMPAIKTPSTVNVMDMERM